MPYTTVGEVREALSPEGVDSSNATAAALSDASLDDAIAEATAEVDGRVRGTPYPDDAVPPLIATITRDVAAYLATLTHRRGNPLPADHPVRLRYLRAEDLLAQAAKGNLDLPPGADGDTASGEVAVVNQYDGQMWQLEDLGLGVDSRALPRQNDPWP